MDYRDYTKKWERVFVGKSFGDGYGGIYRNKEWIQKITAPIVHLIKQCANEPSVFIADIGCGSGILGLNALHLADYNNTFLHAIDVNSSQLDGLKEEARRLNINRNYQAVNSNMFDIAYPDNFFGGIMGRLFLHHLTHDDNSRFWQFVVAKLKSGGISSIYAIVAPNKAVSGFIREVYEWRAKKVGVKPQGFIPTNEYVAGKLSAIKGISFEVFREVRGPLYVSGRASIQEKVGLQINDMDGLEKIFKSAPRNVQELCKIRKISHASPQGRIETREFFWPCQLVVIRKE